MKIKENWKRFCTLNRHHAEGFTLVELIVVIAILAILGGVAIPAYSGYVKKANMQADMSLISDVEQALMLHYYNNDGDAVGGYVVLKPNGAKATGDGTVGDTAMKAVFGENWEDTATLKYDGWTDDGILASIMGDEYVEEVANSNFVKNNSPAQLVDAVSKVTNALTDTILNAGMDPVAKLGDLRVLSDEQLAGIRTDLGDLDWTNEDDKVAYSNKLSNLMVKYVADEYKNMNVEDYIEESPDGLAGMAMNYALVYAWASSSENGKAVLDDMNAAMQDGSIDSEALINTFMDGVEKAQQDQNYEEMYATDYMALYSIMGTVSDISKNFDMNQAGLYSSDSISNKVNNYTNAVSAVNGLTTEQRNVLNNLENGSVVVFVTANGMVASVPNPALAG